MWDGFSLWRARACVCVCVCVCLQVLPFIIPFVRGLETIHGNVEVTEDGGRFPLANLVGMFGRLKTIVGNLIITAPHIVTLDGAFTSLVNVTGSIQINGLKKLASMAGTFKSLANVGGGLKIVNNAELTTLGSGFSSLANVDRHLSVNNNAALISLAGAFPALAAVGRHVAVYSNDQLATLGDAFARLAAVPSVCINGKALPALAQLASSCVTCGCVNAWCTPASAFAGLGSEGPRTCSITSWKTTRGFFWASGKCYSGVEGVYSPPQSSAPSVFKLSARVLPDGNDARKWYQDQCAQVGLRPVSCGGTYESYAAYNAVRLPSVPYSCNVASHIRSATGWTDIVAFASSSSGYLTSEYKGLCPTHDGRPVHPICAI